MKKIYVESLGCAKNQVDSELLLSYSKEEGYTVTRDPREADIIIVNTCGFIESAKKESIDTFFSFRNAFPEKQIILAGCLAQRYSKDLELEEADAIFGNHDLEEIKVVLRKLEKEREQIIYTPCYRNVEDERNTRSENLSFKSTAYLKISEGCNHRCHFCAIPVIRGGLRSRPMDSIIEEAKKLISEGIYEINLVAQDLGYYGIEVDGKQKFTQLIKALAELEGNFVLRMLYIHPDTFPLELLDIVKDHKKILPYFDIPFQHADARVLRNMKRTGNRETYVDLINKIRTAIPEAVIRSTIMLAHPGEDREAFEEVLKFLEEAQLDWMGSFLYSREEDTVSFEQRKQREHNKAVKRAAEWKVELETLQSDITAKRLKRFIGKTYYAVVEEEIKGEDLAIARIYSQAPDVDGLTVIMGQDMKEGDIVKVGIKAVRGVDLEAIKIC